MSHFYADIRRNKMHTIDTHDSEDGRLRLRVVVDPDPADPREWDNLGHMACWHPKYSLGDERPSEGPQDWLAQFMEKSPGAVVLPLYLHEHGGITMNTGGFSCPWDSGQVGYIVAPAGTEGMSPEQIDSCLRSEVEIYDHYLTGSVYGFVLERRADTCGHCGRGGEWSYADSCWGFYGDADPLKNGVAEHLGGEDLAALGLAVDHA